MADDELDALDRACAEAMGFIPSGEAGMVRPGAKWAGAFMPMMSPTRSWEDFGALLRWAGETEEAPLSIKNYGGDGFKNDWEAEIEDAGETFIGTDKDPRIALARAVKAWREAR